MYKTLKGACKKIKISITSESTMISYFYSMFNNHCKCSSKSDYCSDCFLFKQRLRNASSIEEKNLTLTEYEEHY